MTDTPEGGVPTRTEIAQAWEAAATIFVSQGGINDIVQGAPEITSGMGYFHEFALRAFEREGRSQRQAKRLVEAAIRGVVAVTTLYEVGDAFSSEGQRIAELEAQVADLQDQLAQPAPEVVPPTE